MKLQTFSIVAGSSACNARCPFCISKMTPLNGITPKLPDINLRNFRKAALLAKQLGAYTAMITGKGEPTMYPDQISSYLGALEEFEFPLVELQTNGILLYEQKEKYQEYLKKWFDSGLTTIAVSIVHYDAEKNRENYLPYKKQYIDLPELIRSLHSIGYCVRLACILADGYIDDVNKLEHLIAFAKQHKVEQLTLRPVNRPEQSKDVAAADWFEHHFLKPEQKKQFEQFFSQKGHPLMRFEYGAAIYDINGQNVCFTNSLTLDADRDIRQLIFFPEGRVRYDWQYEGAVML
ncbi:MAG: radical SAM protein [Candidatus Aenigmarchaeota archaeon]|nr:radical SAM protein [Candidatus Aenigmarchaeota archaeon]